MKLIYLISFACALALAGAAARAQWITQSFNLRAGWNAVYLHVDATHATLNDLVGAGAPVVTPIEEVWRWTPSEEAAQFLTSPEEPVNSDTRWATWRRSDPGGATLQRLTANTAYLVFSSADFTLNLKGRPTLPEYDWTASGLNFFGFPTLPAAAPNFESFLSAAPGLLAGQIFRYSTGVLGSTNPARVFALRTTPVQRGEAYWLRADEGFGGYQGPFEILTTAGGSVSFGKESSTYGLRIRNRWNAPLTVTLALRTSEAPPAGQPAITGVPPLLIRGPLNTTNLTYGYTVLPLDGAQQWSLTAAGQPGSEAEVVLGLDRSNLTGFVDSLSAGILQFSDSLGHTRVDLAVSAHVDSRAGLWVGAASVTQVGQYLRQYLRDGTGELVVATNGAYVITGAITNLTPVPPSSAFPLRLIVHNPDSGPATLWQRLYLGFDAAANPVIANREAALSAPLISEARRISATHLPWSEANAGWNFSGPLDLGSVVVAAVTNEFFKQESNPFLHTYHPDHDNLDATFRRELPQGSESYSIVREITLRMIPPTDDFGSRTGSGTTIKGDYFETIRLLGLRGPGNSPDTRRFDVQGRFQLNRISQTATVTRLP